MARPRVSVVMPTFDQEDLLPAAVASLRAQTLTDWELVVVDDGSPGDVGAALAGALDDERITLVTLARNGGLGAALNRGLEATSAPYVAYLPSDDLLHAGHLASLVAVLDARPDAVLAHAGVRFGEAGTTTGQVEGEPLQLVQVLHRRTEDRWVERAELTTDDLDRMLWTRLRERGAAVATGAVTCEWVDHPRQRHKVMREPVGGLNPYRARYGVREPLRFHGSRGHLHDEVELHRADRARPSTPRAPDGLRILLVGELSHNPDRVLALEERGHELFGLWTPDPHWFNSVGPMPFGHVTDLPRDGWREAVRRVRPDVVYALLNWPAVPFAREVLDAGLGIPFVWHLKEGPFDARRRGVWRDLVELQTRSDGLIHSSAEARDWWAAMLPATAGIPEHVLDGDLPRRHGQGDERSALLSDADGDLHTVIPGRPLGPAPDVVERLARLGVHLHVYSGKAQAQWRDWVEEVRRRAPGHVHLHAQVDRDGWVQEFSRYDAGWLHDFVSDNGGDLRAATWSDLNVPARMGTLAAAGVPMIQRDNGASRVATQTLARELGNGVFYRDADDLAAQLRDRAHMDALRAAAWRHRDAFTFDAHAGGLVAFLREVVARTRSEGRHGRERRTALTASR